MSSLNKEMQLRKNCQLYAYLLTSLKKEVPEEIEDCIGSYDDVINCVAALYKELQSLDSESFERIVNRGDTIESRELSYWWQMQQEADRLHRYLSSDAE